MLWNGPLFLEPYRKLSDFFWTISQENCQVNGPRSKLVEPVYVVLVDIANALMLPQLHLLIMDPLRATVTFFGDYAAPNMKQTVDAVAGLLGHYTFVKRWATVTDHLRVCRNSATVHIRNARILLSLGTSMAAEQPISSNIFEVGYDDRILEWAGRLCNNHQTTLAKASKGLFNARRVIMMNSVLDDCKTEKGHKPDEHFYKQFLRRVVSELTDLERDKWSRHNSGMQDSSIQDPI